jgi:cAMP-dependent protein kinase regulator
MYSTGIGNQSVSSLNPLEFLGETRRRREELYNSLRTESTFFQSNTSPTRREFGEREAEQFDRRFELFDEKLNNLESRVKKLELHQNIVYNVDNEAINRLKRELHRIKLQYLQTATQSEDIVARLYQENQELRSRLLTLNAENERLRSLVSTPTNTASPLQSQTQLQPLILSGSTSVSDIRLSGNATPLNRAQTSNTTANINSTSNPPSLHIEPRSGSKNLTRAEVAYPQGYDPMRRRFSVSSECINPEEVLNTQPKVVPKSEELKNAIRNAVRHNVLFKHLNAEQLEEIVNAMWEVTYNPGDIVIKQNDDGDNMYIVSKGELDVLYSGEVVATIGPGKAFGEIALMYNCPRTATVRAVTPVTLWAMDRGTFRRILMQESIRRRALYESFLAKVPIFESLLPYERAKVADALDSVTFNDGDVIIRQGDTEGDKFYIIEKGEVVCEKSSDPNSPPVEAMRLGPGDYFGELALLTNQPRQATVKAVGPVKCLTISREHFVQVMGPCEEILKRNMKNYATYEDLIKRNALQNTPNNINLSSRDKNTAENVIKEKTDRFTLAKRIYDDERQYINKLNSLVKGYRDRIVQRKDLKVSIEEIDGIFSNSESLLNVHEIFLKEFDEKMHAFDDPLLGELFLNFAKTLKIYKPYVQSYYSSLVLRSKRKQSPAFIKFLKDMKASFAFQEDLDKLLELPFTRVSVYTRLVTALLNATDEKHPDREPLQTSVKAFLELEATLDEIKKQTEKVYNIYMSISGEHDNFVDPNRIFLREDECLGTDGEKYKSFLFNDILILAKLIDVGGGETKYLHFKTIDLKKMQIARTNTEVRFVWTNRQGKSEYVNFPMQDNTNIWVDAILEVLNKNLTRTP